MEKWNKIQMEPGQRGKVARLFLKSYWWHRHLAGAAHRLEACATKGGGRGRAPTRFFMLYG
jgi:hypothetical protein